LVRIIIQKSKNRNIETWQVLYMKNAANKLINRLHDCILYHISITILLTFLTLRASPALIPQSIKTLGSTSCST
jgi:hypothetical protein